VDKRTMFRPLIIFLAALALVAALALPAAGRPDTPEQRGIVALADTTASGTVSVMMGVERPGSERRACGFKDGYLVQRAEISERRIIVSDPLNRESWRSVQIPELENYSVQQITCLRSTQSGYLILVIGGFEAGTRTQRAIVISTGYPIRAELTKEQWDAGER
jgi:hypothetical protein